MITSLKQNNYFHMVYGLLYNVFKHWSFQEVLEIQTIKIHLAFFVVKKSSSDSS